MEALKNNILFAFQEFVHVIYQFFDLKTVLTLFLAMILIEHANVQAMFGMFEEMDRSGFYICSEK